MPNESHTQFAMVEVCTATRTDWRHATLKLSRMPNIRKRVDKEHIFNASGLKGSDC
jgi:hypothetical protein